MSTPTPAADAALPPPPPPAPAGIDLAALQAAGFPGFPSGLDASQIMSILKGLPQYSQITQGQGLNKEDAAQALAQFQQAHPGQPFVVSDPGPSSHPHGPPPPGYIAVPVPVLGQAPMTAAAPGGEGEDDEQDGDYNDQTPSSTGPGRKASGGRRGRGGAAMGSEEWARQRKDNHKEVERRRRGNINEGIDELGRIVPNGSGEKSKGAILARAVQYIHHLKENEARNIEKWTLEKLLMDQAMGDLQVQLDEIRRMWEEERSGRARVEAELEALRGKGGVGHAEKRPSPDGEQETSESKKARTES